jgi:hypothetical protein
LSFRARELRFNGGMIAFTFRWIRPTALVLLAVALVAGCATKQEPPVAAAKPVVATPASPANASGPLFDGKTLTGWISSDFAGRGEVKVQNGEIKIGMGYMTGITWTNASALPRTNYELSLDAMRVDGSDFFCGLTFPVGKDQCSLVVGGWGGGTVGLSSIDGEDASQNETTSYLNFTNGKWYHIRVRVEPENIQAWIDNDRVVNLDTKEKRLGIRLEMESSVPLGVATWNTAAALKNIQLKKL